MKQYKAIYKCRLCGKEFEREAFDNMGDYPTASICVQHVCGDGRWGAGDLQGTYEVNKKADWENYPVDETPISDKTV